jgi:hypothetical protein
VILHDYTSDAPEAKAPVEADILTFRIARVAVSAAGNRCPIRFSEQALIAMMSNRVSNRLLPQQAKNPWEKERK